MQGSSLVDLSGKTISLVGYGVSNQAVLDYLIKNNVYPIVRSKENVELPKGVKCIFGDSHLYASEDIVFRSPSVRGDTFFSGSQSFTEISYSLERAKCHKIGITGSDGKTTTSTLINKILEKDNKSTYLVGNVGTPLISQLDKIKNDDFLVCELSSFQLYDYTPCLDVAVITSISPNHLDWHTSMAEYVFSKRNILKKSKRAVVNYTSPYRDFFMHQDITYFSLENIEKMVESGTNCVYIKNGCAYYNKKRLFDVDIVKLKGEHNLLNILASIGATYDYVDIYSIIDVVSSFEGVCHRAELICVKNGVFFIDSSVDSTPTRTKATLSIYPRERSIVILGGYDKNLSYSELRDVTDGIKCAILLGENREKIYKAIENSAKKIIMVNNLADAVLASYKEANEGDYVVLSPASASFDMFKNYKERAKRFRDLVKSL